VHKSPLGHKIKFLTRAFTASVAFSSTSVQVSGVGVHLPPDTCANNTTCAVVRHHQRGRDSLRTAAALRRAELHARRNRHRRPGRCWRALPERVPPPAGRYSALWLVRHLLDFLRDEKAHLTPAV